MDNYMDNKMNSQLTQEWENDMVFFISTKGWQTSIFVEKYIKMQSPLNKSVRKKEKERYVENRTKVIVVWIARKVIFRRLLMLTNELFFHVCKQQTSSPSSNQEKISLNYDLLAQRWNSSKENIQIYISLIVYWNI